MAFYRLLLMNSRFNLPPPQCIRIKSGKPFMGFVKVRAIIKSYYIGICVCIQELPLPLASFSRPPPPVICVDLPENLIATEGANGSYIGMGSSEGSCGIAPPREAAVSNEEELEMPPVGTIQEQNSACWPIVGVPPQEERPPPPSPFWVAFEEFLETEGVDLDPLLLLMEEELA